jgi:hypothetical protein
MTVKCRASFVLIKTGVAAAAASLEFRVKVRWITRVIILADPVRSAWIRGVEHVLANNLLAISDALRRLVLAAHNFLLLAHYPVLLLPALSLNFLKLSTEFVLRCCSLGLHLNLLGPVGLKGRLDLVRVDLLLLAI